MLAKVDEWSDSFTAVLPVTEESAAELADAIRSNSVLRRKVTAALRSPHMQKKISAEVLESKLTEQGLDLATHMKDGQLAFTKDTIPTLVRFINDDLFKGTFSEQRFAASASTRSDRQRLGRRRSVEPRSSSAPKRRSSRRCTASRFSCERVHEGSPHGGP